MVRGRVRVRVTVRRVRVRVRGCFVPAVGERGGCFCAATSTSTTSAALAGATEQQSSTGASWLAGADVTLVVSAVKLVMPLFFFSLQVQVKRHPQATLNRCRLMTIFATSATAAAPAIVPATTALRSNVTDIPADGRTANVKKDPARRAHMKIGGIGFFNKEDSTRKGGTGDKGVAGRWDAPCPPALRPTTHTA